MEAGPFGRAVAVLRHGGLLVHAAGEEAAVDDEHFAGDEAGGSDDRKTAAPASSSSRPKRFIGVRIEEFPAALRAVEQV